jgi:hypothetical protein
MGHLHDDHGVFLVKGRALDGVRTETPHGAKRRTTAHEQKECDDVRFGERHLNACLVDPTPPANNDYASSIA